MKTRTLPLLAIAALSAGMLTGCALPFGGPSMIETDEIADLAEEALEDEYEVTYRVDDCEDEEIEFAEGEGVDCIATDRDSDTEYEVAIEIVEVKGSEYEVEVELGDVITDEEEDGDDSGDGSGDSLYVTNTELAETTVDALEDVIDYTATDMECETEELELYVGNFDYCYFTGPDDEVYVVEVEITDVDETSGQYEISAEIIE